MTIRQQIANCGGRRFFLVLGCGIVNTGLLIAGLIDQQTYAYLTGATVAAYITGNTAQKALTWSQSSPSTPPSPSQ